MPSASIFKMSRLALNPAVGDKGAWEIWCCTASWGPSYTYKGITFICLSAYFSFLRGICCQPWLCTKRALTPRSPALSLRESDFNDLGASGGSGFLSFSIVCKGQPRLGVRGPWLFNLSCPPLWLHPAVVRGWIAVHWEVFNPIPGLNH